MPGSGWMVSVYPCKILQQRFVIMQMAEKSTPYLNKTTEKQQEIGSAEDNVNVWMANLLSYVQMMEMKK